MKRFVLGLIAIILLIAIVLYAMGFWSAEVEQGQLPRVNVEAEGGRLPKVAVDSNIVVGTRETNVGAPEVGNATIDVPVVGVRDDAPATQQPQPAQ